MAAETELAVEGRDVTGVVHRGGSWDPNLDGESCSDAKSCESGAGMEVPAVAETVASKVLGLADRGLSCRTHE